MVEKPQLHVVSDGKANFNVYAVDFESIEKIEYFIKSRI